MATGKALDRQWKLKQMMAISTDRNLIYMKILDSEDGRRVQDAGQVFIQGKAFVIQKREPEIEHNKNRINKIPVWVKICDVPKELCIEDGISYAASLVGESHSMDEATTAMTILDYARVCVYIHAGQVIRTEIPVNVGRETIFKAEYEWLPPMCNHCRKFGHSTSESRSGTARTWVAREKTQAVKGVRAGEDVDKGLSNGEGNMNCTQGPTGAGTDNIRESVMGEETPSSDSTSGALAIVCAKSDEGSSDNC